MDFHCFNPLAYSKKLRNFKTHSPNLPMTNYNNKINNYNNNNKIISWVFKKDYLKITVLVHSLNKI